MTSMIEIKRDGFSLQVVAEGRGVPFMVVGSAAYYRRTFAMELREHLRMIFMDMRHFARHEGRVDPASIVVRYVSDAPLYWYDFACDGAWLWEGVSVNAAALAGFKAFFVDYDFDHRAAALDIPVLAVMGRQDFIVPHSLWSDRTSSFRQLYFHVLDGCGHTPQIEQPDQFNRLLLDSAQALFGGERA